MPVCSSLGEVSGSPVVDRTTCTHCGRCAAVCSTGVLTMDDGAVRADTATAFACIACGQCMTVCPTGSVTVTGRGVSPDQLVDLPPRAQRASADALEALMLARRSVRSFRPEPVADDLVDRVIAAASTAPMGIPPWEVGVIAFRGAEKVRELAADVAQAYAALLRFMDRGPSRLLMRLLAKRTLNEQLRSFILPLGREIAAAHRRGEDKVFYGAPVVLLFHTSPYADTSDAAIACTYAMLAAEALGLGTTMIGCASPPLARRRDLLDKYGVPARNKPVLALIMGHPAVTYHRGIRRSFLGVTSIS